MTSSSKSARIFAVLVLCFCTVAIYKMQCPIIRLAPLTGVISRTEPRSQFYNPVDWYENKKTEDRYELPKCQPTHHVVFLKIHKAGSSTLMNLISRYGVNNKLVFALPRGQNYVNRMASLNTSIFLPPPLGREYNLLCNHAVYNRSVFRSFFSNKTKYLGILREPFQQFISAFRYYATFKKVGGLQPVRTFLLYPDKYVFSKGLNFVHNRMIFDLGLDSKYFFDDQKIIDHVQMIDRDFDLILILEYFEESLVLLRRRFCWTIKDILSLPLNSHQNFFTYKYSFKDHNLHRNFSKADYVLYKHFLRVFWRRVFEYGPDFFEEVTFFRNVIKGVQSFCQVKKATTLDQTLFVPGSKWNSPFDVTIADCKLIKMPEMKMMSLLRNLYNKQQKLGSPQRTTIQ